MADLIVTPFNPLPPGDVAFTQSILTLPQSTTGTIFTVANGPIWVRCIVGFVTTAIQAQANATKIQAVATGLSAVDICATGDINGLAVGTLLMPVTSFATALPVTTTNGVAFAGPITAPATQFVMNAGVIRLNCAASNTGAIQWSLIYKPMAPNVTVS